MSVRVRKREKGRTAYLVILVGPVVGILVVLGALFLLPGAGDDACEAAAGAQQSLQAVHSYNEAARQSQPSAADLAKMARNEEAAEAQARASQEKCVAAQNAKRDKADYEALAPLYDLAKFDAYSEADREAVLDAAHLPRSSHPTGFLASTADRAAVLRAFRDHPELYK